MFGFADETYIDVSSGRGGDGAVSFRREKYVPRGGPDGGDGGKGGDVVFEVRSNLKTLSHLKSKRTYRAQNGGNGMSKRRHGADGRDETIQVPPGTQIRDPETGDLIQDMEAAGRWVWAKGGTGGKGNYHFRSATNQAPRYAQPGQPGQAARLFVELHIIADIGFVGFPNAGKSSLLRALTNAKPEVAGYPFTTKIPYLGVLSVGETDIVLADIPGIIEGASQGAGLGYKFLKHISRTKGLAFLVDLSQTNYLEAFDVLRQEIARYMPEMDEKKRLLVGTKLDLPETGNRLKELQNAYTQEQENVIGVSVFTLEGLAELKNMFLKILS